MEMFEDAAQQAQGAFADPKSPQGLARDLIFQVLILNCMSYVHALAVLDPWTLNPNI